MLAAVAQTTTNALDGAAGLRQAIEVGDNQEDFARRLAIERLQRDYGWTLVTCCFLLDHHSLQEIINFAKKSLDALRKGLWLYALDDADLEHAASLPESERACLRFAWFPKTKKNIYAIGREFYALFSPAEVDLVQKSGKTLYDMTVLTHLKTILSPAVRYTSRNRVDESDDPNDDDWSPCSGNPYASKRPASAAKRGAAKTMAKKSPPAELARSSSPAVVELDLQSRESSPQRSESLPLTRARKSKPRDDEQQLVLYDVDRSLKKLRKQDYTLQLQLHESETERRLATVEHEHKMSEMQARLTQMEMEKRMAILEIEKRASDERAALLTTINDKELALKQKEIDLLREKECFLTDKCKQMATRSVGAPPLTIAFGPPPQQTPNSNNNNAFVAARNPFALFPAPQQPSQLEVGRAPMRPVEAAPRPMDPERVAMHRQVQPFVNSQGRFNLSVTSPDFYDLRDVLSKVITTNQNGAPLSEEDESLLRSGLLNDYRIFLRNNNDPLAPSEQREQQLFALDSQDNRINCSNILLHYAFLRKAREFNGIQKLNKKTGVLETKHTIEVTDELRFSYGQDCASLWFPKLTHGVNTIVSESLRFFALSHKSGAGDGKICPFCCKNYINYSSGNIKNMHQLYGCDVLANLSQNERVVLEKVLAQRAASNDFATHKLISPYSEQSILRRATPQEIHEKHYVRCKLTGDRLRLNMEAFMKLRADTWEEFLKRLNAFSTSKMPLYNLHAQPFARMIDALNIEQPMTRPPAKLPSLGARPAPKKVVVPPKQRPAQMSDQQKGEAKQRERIARCRNTFLGKVLLNHRGENYLANLPLRDFSIDEETGFGDGMYFETAAEQADRERRDARMAQLEKQSATAASTATAPPAFIPPLGPFNFPFVFPPNPMFQATPAPGQQHEMPNLFAQLPRAATQQESAKDTDADQMAVIESAESPWSIGANDGQHALSFEEHGSSEFNMFSHFEQGGAMFGTPPGFDSFGSQSSGLFQSGFGSQ